MKNLKFTQQKTYYSLFTSILCLFVTPLVLQAQPIAAGGWHSLVVCADSTVKGFGENASGQLGDGTTTDQSNPVSVANLSGIVSVSAGGDQLEAHSMALKKDGTVWCWGSNLYGGLGNGSTTNSLSPVQAITLTNVRAIAAGGWHSAALKNDSTVWVWGWNSDGQIGDGTNLDKTIPTQVPGLTGVTEIAAGTYHMLALKQDGTVWAWGDNVSGQLGDGTTTDKNTPVQVSGLSNVVRIDAGRFFSLAIKSDGTVWTWGENLYGQLGNGNTTNSPVPVQVSGLSGITTKTVAAGAFHCMVEKNDGTLWSWGRNTYGNLGDNTVTNSSVPVAVSGISNVGGMEAGTNFTIVYKNDGTFWGCGRNASGQLGDGTVLQHNVLTQSTGVCSIVAASNVDDNAWFGEVSIAPNPSYSGEFSLQLPSHLASNKTLTIALYSMLGEKIETAIPVSSGLTRSINLQSQPNGVYLLHLIDANHHAQFKLIKQ